MLFAVISATTINLEAQETYSSCGIIVSDIILHVKLDISSSYGKINFCIGSNSANCLPGMTQSSVDYYYGTLSSSSKLTGTYCLIMKNLNIFYSADITFTYVATPDKDDDDITDSPNAFVEWIKNKWLVLLIIGVVITESLELLFVQDI